tara:strand:+ start:1603 stop:1908 length:306 start_codon:yes stop_codon:yes gene_type:complete
MSKSNKISKQEVQKIAKLSKLKLSNEEIDLYSKQMNQIINYVSQLDSINTSNVSPLSNVIDNKNVIRDDNIQPSIDKSITLKNAPKSDEEFIYVPKIIRSK